MVTQLVDSVEVIHKLKRLSQKLGIKVYRALALNPTKLGEAERDAASIFRKLVKAQSSELLTSPISQKKYVRNDENQILLILDSYEITLINHIFSYTIRISQKTCLSLCEAFNLEIEKRRMEMETGFRENVIHSLKTILSKINE